MVAKPAQANIHMRLCELFGSENVDKEWFIPRTAKDIFGEEASYIPRPDIAVGPYNSETHNVQERVEKIQEASSHPLVQKIIKVGESQNTQGFILNRNPRCLLAIEIVFSGSSKHVLGDHLNASMMGYVGVIVASPKMFKKVRNIGSYVQKLRTVGKASPDLFMNTVYFEAEEFFRLLA